MRAPLPGPAVPYLLAGLLRAGLLLAGLLLALPARAAESPLTNGGFTTWQAGQPAGWRREVGARAGPADTPATITRLAGGGVALAGDGATNRWPLLAQAVDAKPGTHLALRYRARGLGLTQEAGQFGSCYVGFVIRGADGGPNGFEVADVRHADWQEGTVYLRVPPQAARVDVALFLSQTGRLEVSRLALERLAPEASFDVLVAEMDRKYSYFHLHDIDWQALVAKHAGAARAAKTPTAFIAAIRPMLAALEDGHVWIQAPDGTRTVPWTPRVTPNFDVQVLRSKLVGAKQVIRNVLTGRTPEGFGYLALGTLQFDAAQYAAVEAALRSHFDTPGIILDLRVNGGGREAWAQRLCGFLARERVLYARARVRNGPAHDDLARGAVRHVTPAEGTRYAGPVVGLIGPGCGSSGEGMAMMLAALPGAMLIGRPTRGSSGNPQPVTLPNGVTVWFSRWVSLLPDGTPIERRGVPPDVAVEHVPGEDRTLDEAVKILKAKAAKR